MIELLRSFMKSLSSLSLLLFLERITSLRFFYNSFEAFVPLSDTLISGEAYIASISYFIFTSWIALSLFRAYNSLFSCNWLISKMFLCFCNYSIYFSLVNSIVFDYKLSFWAFSNYKLIFYSCFVKKAIYCSSFLKSRSHLLNWLFFSAFILSMFARYCASYYSLLASFSLIEENTFFYLLFDSIIRFNRIISFSCA
jgi:hypothetical protein